ncbi:methyl-accepting chemotaxis protein [Pseudomarimonas arenosa]|uniref:PAS domain S-box protein n=1 Tax=Pseudomarimonas arenosa TaxID=2774145 RepID=A0AAW3ZI35_9GAMM|nr:methyl-accepting chemotaxis protein [Pseudomarimonas arenosa]MBD8524362.1 PAS domain S-box protein [Pseudomarimonas arenosa]
MQSDRKHARGFIDFFRSGRGRLEARNEALCRSQAVIEFQPTGTIEWANENFLAVMGYRLHEVVGQHHRMFVAKETAASADYSTFWRDLQKGEFKAGQFCRRNKAGKDVWLQATYNPIMDRSGRVESVVKFAMDITVLKLREYDVEGQISAINTNMAVIEFDLDGRILRANAGFLQTMGYTEAEVVGQHHSMFIEPAQHGKAEYKAFWADLRAGKASTGSFGRIGKGGRRVWIEASYNPIIGPDGRPFKVVKYATDVTAQRTRAADANSQLRAIGKVQAVIEFTLSGEIVTANDNFLRSMGYQLEEIQGQHHRRFVTPEFASSADYRAMWEQLASGQPITGQFQRLRKDGTDIWLNASYNPILDADGKPVKVIKYATDVTAQVALANALKQMVLGINQTAEKIKVASAEIASGNADLSARTESQAASLEETASSMEELTATVKQNADAADEANRLSAQAAAEVKQGAGSVEGIVETMKKIASSSKKVGEIIGVIDGIAFQTNILALNAAVEAARAGEQGRGFAVVASEVRSLAQRCAEAARDIKQLIAESSQQVADGTQRVEVAGRTMEGIRGSIDRVSELMREIAAGSAEQSVGIEQVSKTVVQLDDATQQNAAMVEEASAAARALDEQASALHANVEAFLRDNKLDAE